MKKSHLTLLAATMLCVAVPCAIFAQGGTASETRKVANAQDVEAGKIAQDESKYARAIVVSRNVLIIRQTRAAHDEIVKVIQRLNFGDGSIGGMGGGMGGGGGFGGGFFSIPAKNSVNKSN